MPGGSGWSSNRLRHAFAGPRQHLAGEDAGGVQHFLLREIAKGKLADEVVGAGFTRHAADLLADGARGACDTAAVLHDRIKVLGDARVTRLRAVDVPELHETL